MLSNINTYSGIEASSMDPKSTVSVIRGPFEAVMTNNTLYTVNSYTKYCLPFSFKGLRLSEDSI